jgi:hypothetical protein
MPVNFLDSTSTATKVAFWCDMSDRGPLPLSSARHAADSHNRACSVCAAYGGASVLPHRI